MRRIAFFAQLLSLAIACGAFAAPPTADEVIQDSNLQRGVALVIAKDAQLAMQLADKGDWLVHLLVPPASEAGTLTAEIRSRGLGGRVVIGKLPADGRLPHGDRMLNLVVADFSKLGDAAPRREEIDRVLAVRGVSYLREQDEWVAASKSHDEKIDGWFSHWYNASGNCVSNDQTAGFPQAVQWRHGPGQEDGTADGKIPRIADGRVLFVDNLSGELVCRDAGNGLLLWKRNVGAIQATDVCIAAGQSHLWFQPVEERKEKDQRREVGRLTAFDLATGEVSRVYDQGVVAGTAASVEVPWHDRTRKVTPVPWFVVSDELVVQAYAGQLVVLDRKSGKRLWEKRLDKLTWFSPVVAGDMVIAAEAATPAQRRRNNGTDHAQAVVAFDARSGKPLWRNENIHPLRKVTDEKKGATHQSRASFKSISVASDRVLLHVSSYQFRDGGSIAMLDQQTGKELWRREYGAKQLYTQGSQRPIIRGDEVIMLDGTGVYRYRADNGEPIGEPIKRPRDLRRSGRANSACTASRATTNWLMANAWLYVGPDGQPHYGQGARGACGQGVVPAHGLVYVPPTPCDCGDYLRGYLALAPRHSGAKVADDERWVRGVDAPAAEGFSAPWPLFLGNAQRTTVAAEPAGDASKSAWSCRVTTARSDAIAYDRSHSEYNIGPITAPVVGGGLAVVAAPQSHEVVAIDNKTGKVRWRFPAGGRVDSPPTLAAGMAVFGCDDGNVYSVRMADGKLVWRYFIAPTNGLAIHHGHLGSAYPVPGSVLVLGDKVIAVAGCHTDLGGLHVASLDLTTGKRLATRVLGKDAPPAIGNNLTVADREGRGFYVVSLPGGSYGGGGAYHLTPLLEDIEADEEAPRPTVIFDRQGARLRFRTNRGRGGSTHGWKGAMHAGGFSRLRGHRIAVIEQEQIGYALTDPSDRTKVAVWCNGPERNPQPKWEVTREQLGGVESLSSILVAGDKLYVGGGDRDGKRGRLFVVDRTSGKVQQTIELPARVVECGLAAADGHLYVSTEAGSLHKW